MRTKAYIIAFILLLAVQKTYSDTRTQQICAVSPLVQYTIDGPEGMIFHWQVEGGVITSDNPKNDTIWVRWNGIGAHRISVYGEYEGCFTDKRDLNVDIKNPPIVTLGPDVHLCEGEKHTFEVDEYASILWHDQSVGRWFTTGSSGQVWVRVTNSFGCSASDTANVIVHPLPFVDLGKDTMLCDNIKLTLDAYNPQNNNVVYEWNVTDAFGVQITEPAIQVSSPGSYWVKVTDINNCSNYDTLMVKECNIKIRKEGIPTVFTPNGDGKNDVWKLDELQIAYPNAVVEVYDRWGRLVFKSDKGYPEPWDGKDKATRKDLPMNNYFYIIYPNKKGEDPITGTVSIAR